MTKLLVLSLFFFSVSFAANVVAVLEIGRAIGANFISQGTISKFGGDLSVSIQLYESMGGKLLGSVSLESPDVKSLLAQIFLT